MLLAQILTHFDFLRSWRYIYFQDLGVTFDSKLRFGIHSHEVINPAAKFSRFTHAPSLSWLLPIRLNALQFPCLKYLPVTVLPLKSCNVISPVSLLKRKNFPRVDHPSRSFKSTRHFQKIGYLRIHSKYSQVLGYQPANFENALPQKRQ